MPSITAALVRAVLEKCEAYEWTAQGFGFIRTKLADIGRIHLWDSRVRTQGVSDVHAHPWPLSSTIVSGEMINQRYTVAPDGFDDLDRGSVPYLRSRIATGEGGGLIGEPEPVRLRPAVPEHYLSDDFYEQSPEEIHRSIPQDGTVTLLTRPMGPPLQETFVFWPRGHYWVSAEPVKIDDYKVRVIVDHALARWDAR